MGEDYLLRMIEQVRLMVANILAARLAGRNDDAMKQIEAACLHSIGLPWALVKRSSPEELSELMQRSGERYAKAVLLAELLLQDAELSEIKGNFMERIRSQFQAFCLLQESFDILTPDEKAVYRPKMNALAQSLVTVSDAPYLQKKLSDYKIKSMA